MFVPYSKSFCLQRLSLAWQIRQLIHLAIRVLSKASLDYAITIAKIKNVYYTLKSIRRLMPWQEQHNGEVLGPLCPLHLARKHRGELGCLKTFFARCCLAEKCCVLDIVLIVPWERFSEFRAGLKMSSGISDWCNIRVRIWDVSPYPQKGNDNGSFSCHQFSCHQVTRRHDWDRYQKTVSVRHLANN